jgi:ATP citrate (pro-S)-lyase
LQEADEVVEIGYLNALFVVARSIGLIGHALDQKRLQQPLYRHPWWVLVQGCRGSRAL